MVANATSLPFAPYAGLNMLQFWQNRRAVMRENKRREDCWPRPFVEPTECILAVCHRIAYGRDLRPGDAKDSNDETTE
eukprot:scaffold7328_cov314-Pinguiococcus_pyrenoidosus.AAC.64